MTSPPIGQQIRAVREAAGLSQEKLAKVLGCKQTYISCVERGEFEPRTRRLQEFAAALDATCMIGKTITFTANRKR